MTVLRTLALLSFSLLLCAGDDTPEARLEAAKRYMDSTGLDQIINDTSKAMSQQMPEEQREAFIHYMKNADWEKVKATSTEVTAKHLTVKEIKAMEAFYGSPEGKAIMAKFPQMMADMMPMIQAEVTKMVQDFAVEKSKERYKEESQ